MHYKVKIESFTTRLESINVLRSFYKSLDSEIGLKEIVHYFDEHASKSEYKDQEMVYDVLHALKRRGFFSLTAKTWLAIHSPILAG